MTRFVGAGRWSRGPQLSKPQYSKMKLVKVAYGNDDDQTSFQQPQGLLQANPNLTGSAGGDAPRGHPSRCSCLHHDQQRPPMVIDRKKEVDAAGGPLATAIGASGRAVLPASHPPLSGRQP
jgi:hypothetical protein